MKMELGNYMIDTGDSMSKEFIEKWYSKIPEIERNLPVIYFEGKVYTPKEIYDEVMNDSEVGEKIQNMLERMSSPHTIYDSEIPNLRKAAEHRVKKIIEMLPDNFTMASLSGLVIGKDKIEKMLWKEAVETELSNIIRLIKRGGEK